MEVLTGLRRKPRGSSEDTLVIVPLTFASFAEQNISPLQGGTCLLGQSRHFDRAPLACGFPRIAEILRVSRHVSMVPRGDISANLQPGVQLNAREQES